MAVTKPSFRAILSEQRTFLGLTQTEIGREIGLKRGMVSVLERESDELIQRGPEFALKFFKAYKFSDEKARDMTRELFQDVLKKLVPDIPPDATAATASGPQAMYYGTVSAGIKGEGKAIKPYPVNIPSWLAARYNPEDIFVLTVVGDSMTCSEVRKTIPEGSEVYFHRSLQPNNGEVVAVWLEDRDIGVIKIYRPDRETSVLESYNHKHTPILIDERNQATVQGVYVGKSEASPLRFD